MKRGEAIGNKATGETLSMLDGEAEDGRARQLYQVRIPPRRPSPPLHYHLKFTETFTVVEGHLDIYLGRDRKHIVLRLKEAITANVRQIHTFGNSRDEWTVIAMSLRSRLGLLAE